MAVAESRKRANVKWDAENMTTLGCRVKKEQADRFKAYCSEIGKTSNAVLRDYVLDCIGEKQDTESRFDEFNDTTARENRSDLKSEPFGSIKGFI